MGGGYKKYLTTEKQKQAVERQRQEKYNREHKLVNGIDYKICSKHNTYFPEENPWFPSTEEYFYVNNKNKTDGLYPYCKRCGIKNSQKHYDKEKHTEQCRFYYHNSEKTIKYQADYRKSWKRKPAERIWRSKNPEKLREYSRKHRDHSISEKEWKDCKEHFNNSCAYCELPVENHFRTFRGMPQKIDLHKEHVVNDGKNDLSNCIPSCLMCNSSKHLKSLDEWYNKDNPDYTEERYNKIIKWTTEEYKIHIKQK